MGLVGWGAAVSDFFTMNPNRLSIHLCDFFYYKFKFKIKKIFFLVGRVGGGNEGRLE